jgi:hypothetical protein
MYLDPQQEIFTSMFKLLSSRFENVYDAEITGESPYPFIAFGECTQNDTAIKGANRGNVEMTLQVYHNDVEKRGTLSAMLYKIKAAACSITATANYGWRVTQMTQRILPDNTTDTPLLHGNLIITFEYIGALNE